MPPVQLSNRFPPCGEIAAMIGGAATTKMFMVAVLDRLPESVTRTTKLFVPASADNGVPDNAPPLATVSHAGPLALANVSASPFGSVAFVAIVPEYGWPAVASGLLNGLL